MKKRFLLQRLQIIGEISLGEVAAIAHFNLTVAEVVPHYRLNRDQLN
jgi:hypothetical protein